MNPLATYLRELRDIRSSGAHVPETSFYSPLANLLNDVGRTLKPRVRCIINPKNQGAGIPDGGFFTADQLPRTGEPDLHAQLPARGVMEVKGTSDDAWQTARSAQVTRYLGTYGEVLVTNYRDFVLLGRDASGKSVELETYRLAASETAFWAATSDPYALAEAQGERFTEFLKRVMLYAAPLTNPADVAWFLASYARDAKARIEDTDLPALTAVRTALEQALGVTFEGRKGEHFFRSTLVQTLFYGIFSAWVLWSKKRAPGNITETFDWRITLWELHVPLIRGLFEQIAMPSKLGPLGLVEVLDRTGAALNRVEPEAFFARFEEGQAVQYFYEPFLEAFDPELRKELGVWYTPPEIVQYMVTRVDTVLRQELGIADGLADPRVYVLDPCCGTGAYLVAVLQRIAATLQEQGGDALLGADLKRAAIERVFGFELLPAPFVVAHLQLGLLLQTFGAPFSDSANERAGVYLTNALTGWVPPTGPKQRLLFPELEAERDAAEHVKRDVPILVILGNPPYNGFAGLAVDEERDLTNAYRTTRRAPAPQGQGLNDLYVRFFRMAERRIVEGTGQGIVCYISNYSWLDGLSFTGMRERYLETFDKIWIDCLNGDKYKTGKLTPEGEPDPSVFSSDFNPEGIQVGTAVTLLVRRQSHIDADTVRFRHLWGRTKRSRPARYSRAEMVRACTSQSGQRSAWACLTCPHALMRTTSRGLSCPISFLCRFPASKRAAMMWWSISTAPDWCSAWSSILTRHSVTKRCAASLRARCRALHASRPRQSAINSASVASGQSTLSGTATVPLMYAGCTGSQKQSCWTRSGLSTIRMCLTGMFGLKPAKDSQWRDFDRGYFAMCWQITLAYGLSNFFPLYLCSVTEHLSLLDYGNSGRVSLT